MPTLTSKERETIENLNDLKRYLGYDYFRGSVDFILDVDEAIKAIETVAQIRKDLTEDCAGCQIYAEDRPCTCDCAKEWKFRWE